MRRLTVRRDGDMPVLLVQYEGALISALYFAAKQHSEAKRKASR